MSYIMTKMLCKSNPIVFVQISASLYNQILKALRQFIHDCNNEGYPRRHFITFKCSGSKKCYYVHEIYNYDSVLLVGAFQDMCGNER